MPNTSCPAISHRLTLVPNGAPAIVIEPRTTVAPVLQETPNAVSSIEGPGGVGVREGVGSDVGAGVGVSGTTVGVGERLGVGVLTTVVGVGEGATEVAIGSSGAPQTVTPPDGFTANASDVLGKPMIAGAGVTLSDPASASTAIDWVWLASVAGSLISKTMG